jgi:single-stranded-DNA-specific exonuclease
MHDFFTALGYNNFEIYIPHRHNEGFGLHLEAVDTFPAKGIKLLITIDCGITDVEEVAHAHKLGIDVIITDHHLPGKVLPSAYAIVNPKQENNKYPFDMLCGSGVAFKLIQGILKKNRFKLNDGGEKWFLDMVGLATLSDMVPLQDENRVLAHYGLKVIRKSRRPGLQKLLSLLKIDQRYITEDDIGFMITPRINAASRMGIPTDAFKMLSEKDEATADAYARHLDSINTERKGLVASLVKEIKKTMSEREDHYRTQKVIVLGNPNWRPALLGLVANSIAEEYRRPVFLWGREDGKYIKGSCRSDGVTDLTKIMESAKHAFLDWGGHKFSGGFSIEHDKIHHLEDALVKACELNVGVAGEQVIPLDAKLSLDDIHTKTFNHIDQLAPFGMANPKPLFIFENVTPFLVKQFGKGQDHLELSFKNSKGSTVRAIGFFMTPDDFEKKLNENSSINLVANVEKSMFRNIPELRLRIVDIF